MVAALLNTVLPAILGYTLGRRMANCLVTFITLPMTGALPLTRPCARFTTFDRCNLNEDQRKDFIAIAAQFEAPVYAVILDLPFEVGAPFCVLSFSVGTL